MESNVFFLSGGTGECVVYDAPQWCNGPSVAVRVKTSGFESQTLGSSFVFHRGKRENVRKQSSWLSLFDVC